MVPALFLLACSPPAEETPPSMQELLWALLRDFDTEAAVEEADALGQWMAGEGEAAESGYVVDTPASAYVDALTFSDNLELGNMSGGMWFQEVRGSVNQHAAVVPEADQTFADPTYDRWDRTIANGSETGYLAGEELIADDDIEKDGGFGIVLPYPMMRHYRWVELENGTGQITRSVIYEEGWTDDGQNGIIGGFTIEVWYPSGDEGMIWVNATWTQVISVVDEFVEDSFYTDAIINGSKDVMAGTEEHVVGSE